MSSSPARLFVIAAPSGAGKTTLVKSLLVRNPGLRFSVSYTTREQRKTEIDGCDYFFVNEERFLQLKSEKARLESALVFGNYYGTGHAQVHEHLAKGNHVILEIDWQGARQVRESMPDCVSIFILPPSQSELERRLRDRRTDSDEVIAHRLQEARGDMSHCDEFEFVIINDELDTAVGELEAILHGGGAANRRGDPELQQKLEKILA